MFKRFLLCFQIALLLTSVLYANTSLAKMGVYVGINAGYSYIDLNTPRVGDNVKRKQYGPAWGADVGLQFNRYFAVEFGYNALANVADGHKDVLTNNQIYHLALKGSLPGENKRCDLFAKAGIASVLAHYVNVSDDQKRQKYTPYFALGVAYHLTPHVAINLQAIATIAQGNNNGDIKAPNSIPAMYAGMIGVTYLLGGN